MMEKVWKTINDIMGRAGENTPSFLELESNSNFAKQLITGDLVKNKDCVFDFQSIQVNEVEKLASLNNENPSELDKLETFEDGLQHYCLTYNIS